MTPGTSAPLPTGLLRRLGSALLLASVALGAGEDGGFTKVENHRIGVGNFLVDNSGELRAGNPNGFYRMQEPRINNSSSFARASFQLSQGTRRVRVGLKSAAIKDLAVDRWLQVAEGENRLRVVDRFSATGDSERTFTYRFSIDFNNPCQRVMALGDSAQAWAGGNSPPSRLNPDNHGLVINGQGFNLLLVASGAQPKVRPVVNAQAGSLLLDYALTVSAGTTVSLMHVLYTSSPADAEEVVASYASPRLPEDLLLDDATRLELLNFPLCFPDPKRLGRRPPPVSKTLEAMGLTPPEEPGVRVQLGEDVSLAGEIAAGQTLALNTRGRTVSLPLEEVMAISRSPGGGVAVLTDRSEVFVGQAESNLTVVLKDFGSQEYDLNELPPAATIIRRVDGNAPAAELAVRAYLVLGSGERLLVTRLPASDVVLPTPWGPARVSLADIRAVTSAVEPYPHLVVQLKNGSRFPAFGCDEPLELTVSRLGELSCPLQELSALTNFANAAKWERAEDAMPDDAEALHKPCPALERQAPLGEILKALATASGLDVRLHEKAAIWGMIPVAVNLPEGSIQEQVLRLVDRVNMTLELTAGGFLFHDPDSYQRRAGPELDLLTLTRTWVLAGRVHPGIRVRAKTTGDILSLTELASLRRNEDGELVAMRRNRRQQKVVLVNACVRIDALGLTMAVPATELAGLQVAERPEPAPPEGGGDDDPGPPAGGTDAATGTPATTEGAER